MPDNGEIHEYNNHLIKMLQILEKKGKLTNEIIDNLVIMLLEEAGISLEKNNEEEYMNIKNTLHLIESIEFNQVNA